MTIPANLYADKIFAEHPTALWSLDDTITGVVPSSISAKNIAVSKTYGIEAASYGTDIFPGYYLADSSSTGSAHVGDSGIPMVYGASNITNVYPITNSPSIVLPAFGFLNESGKNRKMTFEMWIKINNTSSVPKRIFGPIASEDGIYVHNSFITIKIGKYRSSYYVGEWGKPMLLDFVYDKSEVLLLINSEQVITMQIEQENLSFPSNLSETEEDQDWVGFYGYDDVTPISLDCVAIYPYKVSPTLAKKRWIYGQAVPAPDFHSFEDNDIPVIVDYQFSEYGKSYIYPDMGKWSQGSFDNIVFDENDILKMPDYQLPILVAESGITFDTWENENNTYYIDNSIGTNQLDNLESNDLYFFMTPNVTDFGNAAFSEYPSSYFYFNNFANIISETVASIYGVFKSSNQLPSGNITSISETLFRLENNSGEFLEAYLYTNNASATTYELKYDFTDINSNVSTLYSSNVAISTDFVAGISIANLISNSSLTNFFSNPSNISLYLFGNKDIDKTFRGRIYRFGISNFKNLQKNEGIYIDGFADETNLDALSNYASYTLFPSNTFNKFSLDIAINGFWQDYVPLAYFGKNIINANSTESRDLDLLQFSIDYPEPSKYISANVIDTSKSLLKTYGYFSNIPANSSEIIFPSTLTGVNLEYGKTVIPDSDNWENEKYELVNNTVIYPPDNVDFNGLFFNIFVDFNVYGILNNPISLKSLRIGSKSLNETLENPIGTKLGKKLYPYSIVASQKNYKEKNPVAIYTGSTPYLFLTKYSGFRLLGDVFDGSRAISIKLNESSFDYFKISSVQFAMLADNKFKDEDTEVLRIYKNSSSNYYKIYASKLESDSSGKTATLYAVEVDPTGTYPTNETVLTKDSVVISINGKISSLDQPTDLPIKQDEWNMVNIKIVGILDLSGITTGSIDFTGPFVFNNVNSYRINYRNEGDRVFYNSWYDVTVLYPSWDDTNNTGIYWSNVAVDVKSAILGTDPSKIYNTYLGNNRLVIDSSVIPLKTNGYEYTIYKDLTWNTVSTQAL